MAANSEVELLQSLGWHELRIPVATGQPWKSRGVLAHRELTIRYWQHPRFGDRRFTMTGALRTEKKGNPMNGKWQSIPTTYGVVKLKKTGRKMGFDAYGNRRIVRGAGWVLRVPDGSEFPYATREAAIRSLGSIIKTPRNLGNPPSGFIPCKAVKIERKNGGVVVRVRR